MGKKLYVGNLPFNVDDAMLAEYFGQLGSVDSAKVITDRDTGRSKGFAFVEMASEEDAQAAIDKYNQQDFQGRNLTVNEAKPQAPRTGGGGGGGRGGFGGGGGGGRSRF